MSDLISDASEDPSRYKPRKEIFPLTAEKEVELRKAFIQEALTWVGTPYRQLGATKGVAVDCSMLLVRASIDSGIMEEWDPRPYPPLWFLHRDDERYLKWIEMFAKPTEQFRAGDIVAIRFGRAFAHSGILVDSEHLVHAFAHDNICIVSPLNHSVLLYADRTGNTLRPRKYFDVFARMRELGPGGVV